MQAYIDFIFFYKEIICECEIDFLLIQATSLSSYTDYQPHVFYFRTQ